MNYLTIYNVIMVANWQILILISGHLLVEFQIIVNWLEIAAVKTELFELFLDFLQVIVKFVFLGVQHCHVLLR